MVRIPARCPHCGYVIENTGVEFVGDHDSINLEGNKVPCSNCGGWANVLDGRIQTQAGGIQMLAGPQWSWDLVKHLRLGLVRIVEEQPDDPVAAVEEIDPKVGGWLRRATTGWTRDQILRLIGDIIIPLIIGVPAAWNALQMAYDQISEVLKDVTPPEEAPIAPGPGPETI